MARLSFEEIILFGFIGPRRASLCLFGCPSCVVLDAFAFHNVILEVDLLFQACPPEMNHDARALDHKFDAAMQQRDANKPLQQPHSVLSVALQMFFFLIFVFYLCFS